MGCPEGAGTPYPLQVRDRYVLRHHEVRVHWSPTVNGISMRAHNSAGSSECTDDKS